MAICFKTYDLHPMYWCHPCVGLKSATPCGILHTRYLLDWDWNWPSQSTLDLSSPQMSSSALNSTHAIRIHLCLQLKAWSLKLKLFRWYHMILDCSTWDHMSWFSDAWPGSCNQYPASLPGRCHDSRWPGECGSWNSRVRPTCRCIAHSNWHRLQPRESSKTCDRIPWTIIINNLINNYLDSHNIINGIYDPIWASCFVVYSCVYLCVWEIAS